MAPLSSSRSHGAHKNCARAEAAPALGRKLWSTGQTPPGPTVAARTGNRLSHRSMPPVLDSAVDAAGFARLSATASATHWSVLVVAGWAPTDVVHRLGDDVHYRRQDLRPTSGATAIADLGFLDKLGNVEQGAQWVGNGRSETAAKAVRLRERPSAG
jgi:hypothetical protein